MTLDEARAFYQCIARIRSKDKLDALEVANFSKMKEQARKQIIKELKEKLEIGTLKEGQQKVASGEGKPVSLTSLAKILGGKDE